MCLCMCVVCSYTYFQEPVLTLYSQVNAVFKQQTCGWRRVIFFRTSRCVYWFCRCLSGASTWFCPLFLLSSKTMSSTWTPEVSSTCTSWGRNRKLCKWNFQENHLFLYFYNSAFFWTHKCFSMRIVFLFMNVVMNIVRENDVSNGSFMLKIGVTRFLPRFFFFCLGWLYLDGFEVVYLTMWWWLIKT